MGFFSKKSDEKKPVPAKPPSADVGRNDPCHCGSGKKYKKCCMAKDESAEHSALEEQWAKSAADAKAQAEKKAKEAPPAPSKTSAKPLSGEQRHPTFVPHQVNMPRRSGGGS